jgi:hypothetical protein
MHRFVSILIGATFVAILCFWFVVAYLSASFAEGQDWSGGIRPVIEKIWCGKPGCLGK